MDSGLLVVLFHLTLTEAAAGSISGRASRSTPSPFPGWIRNYLDFAGSTGSSAQIGTMQKTIRNGS